MMGIRANRRAQVVYVVKMPVFRVVDDARRILLSSSGWRDTTDLAMAVLARVITNHTIQVPTPDIKTINRYEKKKNLHFRPERPGERAESCGRHVSAKCVASVKQAFGDYT